MDRDDVIVITGAGGFIGGHLVADFLSKGYKKIRAVDIKPFANWCRFFPEIKNVQYDLKNEDNCRNICKNARVVFNLAADMGGIGFIETHKMDCMLSVLINTNLLRAAVEYNIEHYFYSSSACVYPAGKQNVSDVTALKEKDAYPAMPEDGYGWEKLFSERMCHHFGREFKLETRIARYHNVYGTFGAYYGGREKAPAALCRKIIQAKLLGHHEIEIWGDGTQTRSFMYIDDCIMGTNKIMCCDYAEPVNLGSDRLVTINQLVSIIEKIADIKLKRKYNLTAPMGVKGRNSDNTLIYKLLNWRPHISLEYGLERTYRWIYDQITNHSKQKTVHYVASTSEL